MGDDRMAPVPDEEHAVTPLAAIAERHRAYTATPISQVIADCDDMLLRGHPNALPQYLESGRSAIEVITAAMVATRTESFESALDLPCGGGRTTRHLRAFLPETTLFVGELDLAKRQFVVETFGAMPFEAPHDFLGIPARTFDLIFVGSLLTHLNLDLFVHALKWFVGALAEGALLIMTTHGRRHEALAEQTRSRTHLIDPKKWATIVAGRDETGFGYAPYDDARPTYGISLVSPSWLTRLAVESDSSTRIVGFHEAAWHDHQDVLVMQKRSVSAA